MIVFLLPHLKMGAIDFFSTASARRPPALAGGILTRHYPIGFSQNLLLFA